MSTKRPHLLGERWRRLAPLALAPLIHSNALAERRIDPPKVEWSDAIAIVCDSATATANEADIAAWRTALEADGWATWLVIDTWLQCQDVRDQLRQLASATHPIRGAILIGDIPLARIHRVDHLLSLVERESMRQSKTGGTISETYYSDLDLVFEPATDAIDTVGMQDFELAPESPQTIERELFVSRVRTAGDADTRRAQLTRFCAKAARAHAEPREFAHGLVVEARQEATAQFESWIRLENELFPTLRLPGKSLRNVLLAREQDVKSSLARAIRERPLDLCVLRGAARDDDWLPFVSTLAGRQRVVVFDASATDGEVANAFLFGGSATVSVATGFDDGSCAEARLGLLALGASVGGVYVSNPVLDARLFGDPTIAFGTGGLGRARTDFVGREGVDADTLAQWMSESAPPALRARAVDLIGRTSTNAPANAAESSTSAPEATRSADSATARAEALAQLVRLAKSDPASIVRLAAFEGLARTRSNAALASVFETTIVDPADEVRAVTARMMGELARREDLPRLLRVIVRDGSPRVVARAKNALFAYEPTLVGNAIDDLVAPSTLVAQDPYVLDELNAAFGSVRRDFEAIVQIPTAVESDARRWNDSLFLGARPIHAIDPLLEVASSEKHGPFPRAAAIEALGWFQFAPNRAEMAAKLHEIAGAASTPERVRKAAQQSARRLADGPNVPLAP